MNLSAKPNFITWAAETDLEQQLIVEWQEILCLYNLLLSKQQPEQVFTQNQAVLLNHQVKFKNWYMLVLSQYHKFESYKINIYSVSLMSLSF